MGLEDAWMIYARRYAANRVSPHLLENHITRTFAIRL